MNINNLVYILNEYIYVRNDFDKKRLQEVYLALSKFLNVYRCCYRLKYTEDIKNKRNSKKIKQDVIISHKPIKLVFD